MWLLQLLCKYLVKVQSSLTLVTSLQLLFVYKSQFLLDMFTSLGQR